MKKWLALSIIGLLDCKSNPCYEYRVKRGILCINYSRVYYCEIPITHVFMDLFNRHGTGYMQQLLTYVLGNLP